MDEDLGRQEPAAAGCDEQGAGDCLVAELAGGAEDAEQQRGTGQDRERTVDELGEAVAVEGRVAGVSGGGDDGDGGQSAGDRRGGDGDQREADGALLE
jgi:hypothetical protein